MSRLVPETLDGPTAAPPAVRGAGWLAPLLALLAPVAPRWAGPRLARSSWTAAAAVHLLGVTWFGLCLAFVAAPDYWDALLGPFRYPSPLATLPAFDGRELLASLRECAAYTLNTVYDATAARGGPWLVAGLIACVCAGLTLLGVAIMPFIAAGERSGLVVRRAVKLSWFASAAWLPTGVLLALVAYRTYPARPSLVSPMSALGPGGFYGQAPWLGAFGVVGGLAWWCGVLLRLGQRYTGPADGPGFAPKLPLCDHCGYRLTGLPAGGACPECGHPIAASLSQAQAAPAFATCPLLLLSVAWWWTGAQVLRRPDLLRAIRRFDGRLRATGFALWTGGTAGALAVIAIPLMVWGRPLGDDLSLWAPLSTMAGALMGLVVAGLSALVIGWRRGGDLRASAAVSAYGLAWLIPALTWWLIGFCAAIAFRAAGAPWRPLGLPMTRAEMLATTGYLSVLGALLLYGFGHYVHLLIAARRWR